MKFGFLNILEVLGSVGIFIYGMKLMSESIQRAAGQQFRNSLSNITSNKWIGYIIGIVVTGIIQSSSATSVLTISFVNAGLLSVVESAGLILGANVGTTVTAWLISLFGFKVSLTSYAVPIFAIGVPMLFINNGRWKYWGEFILGFAIMFIGLGFLRDAVPVINENTIFFEWLKNYTGLGIWSRIIFVLAGVVVAVIVQSSSVAIAITLTLVAQGWLPLEIGACIILGENIGTTSTVWIASIIANKRAKVTARIHFWINVIGVAWMIWVLPGFLAILSIGLHNIFGIKDIYNNHIDMTIGLSAFHTFFNIVNTLILINFTPLLVKIASFGLGDIRDEDRFKGKFLINYTGMPELATIQLQKEIAHFGSLIKRINEYFENIINNTDPKRQRKLIKKIKQLEGVANDMELEITEYVTNLTREEISTETNRMLRTILEISHGMERIADIYFQLSRTMERKINDNIYFLPNQREGINKMISLIYNAIDETIKNLESPDYKNISIKNSMTIENKINKLRDQLSEEHLQKLGEDGYNVQSAMIYSNVFTGLERIGDLIYNVNDSIFKK